MAKILIYQAFGQPYQVYDVPGYSWAQESTSSYFNTETKRVETTTGTLYGGDEREFDTEPVVYPPDLDQKIFWDCAGTTKRDYFHDGYGNITVQETPDSTDCGWYPTFTITPVVVNAVCFASNTASITVDVASNGFPPYTYRWQDGVTTKDRFNVRAGSYTLNVTDSEGFVGSKTIQVGQNPEIILTGTVDDDSITLSVSGGIAPYSYLWSDGSTDKDRTGLGYGQYGVTVTDSLGCKKTFEFQIDSQRFFFSGNPVILQMQALDQVGKSNLSFLCEVWVENEYLSGSFEKVAELEHPADRNGSTRFDVSVYLQAFLQAYFPPLTQNQVSLASGTFKRFYMRYAEKYGRPAVVSDFTVVDYRYVVLGGLGFQEAPKQRFFRELLLQRQPFFSWLPVNYQVSAEQPEFLFFMLHQADQHNFTVKVRTTDKDGIQVLKTAYTYQGCNRFELFCIPVGFTALNLESDVAEWEVWVEGLQGMPLSEVRRYRLDNGYARYRRYFLYLNSLGGIDTLSVTGSAISEVSVKAESMQKMLPAGYDPALGDAEVVESMLQPVLELSTGYIDDQEKLSALADFVLSRQVRMVHQGNYRAGQVRVKKYKPLDETTNIKFLDFEFALPQEQYYTPDF